MFISRTVAKPLVLASHWWETSASPGLLFKAAQNTTISSLRVSEWDIQRGFVGRSHSHIVMQLWKWYLIAFSILCSLEVHTTLSGRDCAMTWKFTTWGSLKAILELCNTIVNPFPCNSHRSVSMSLFSCTGQRHHSPPWHVSLWTQCQEKGVKVEVLDIDRKCRLQMHLFHMKSLLNSVQQSKRF